MDNPRRSTMQKKHKSMKEDGSSDEEPDLLRPSLSKTNSGT
jgi:hypothetical protein